MTPIQLINAYAALANGGTLYQPHLVKEIVGPDGEVVKTVEPTVLHKMDVKPSVLKTMRNAARSTVTLRHTYNLVDMPIKVAGKSGTAEFGTRDRQGRLPFHSWFVGFTPGDPYKGSFDKTDSKLVVLAFAYDSRTKSNAATEIVKYFMQQHYGIEKDYLNPLDRRQLLPEQLMGVIRAEPARMTDWAAKSVGLAWRAFDWQLLTYAALLGAIGLAMAYTNSVEDGKMPLEAGTTFTRGLMWAVIAVVGVRPRDGVRLPLAEDARLADLRPPARAARPHAGDRRRRRRVRALDQRRARSRSSSASWPRS